MIPSLVWVPTAPVSNFTSLQVVDVDADAAIRRLAPNNTISPSTTNSTSLVTFFMTLPPFGSLVLVVLTVKVLFNIPPFFFNPRLDFGYYNHELYHKIQYILNFY